MMEKFEKQFEQLDVQTQVMDETMSSSTTLSVPQVRYYSCFIRDINILFTNGAHFQHLS